MTGPSPRDWLHEAAATGGGREAVAGDVRLTYGELAERAHAAGVHHDWPAGATVPIPVPGPAADVFSGLWGAWRARAVAAPHDPRRFPGGLAAGYHGAHTVVVTSGTTGVPRGVILTEGNVGAAVAASADRIGNAGDDRWLLVLPLFHVGGLSVLWRSAAAAGTVLVHDRFDAGRTATALRSGEATIASLVPTMLRRLLAADPGPFPGEPVVLLGGAPAPAALVEQGLDAGLRVLASYGLTEACSQVTTVVPGDERRSLGTTGPPLPGMRVQVVAAGRAVSPGTAGLIEIAGPAVSPGYAGEPPRAGPLLTADIGRFDDAGRLMVLGRADEVVVTGGENVHPAEVEALLSGCPGVVEAAAFGLPDPEWGQRLVAAVVASPGFDAAAAAAWLRARAPSYLVPREWRIVGELPRNAAGKVDRTALAGA